MPLEFDASTCYTIMAGGFTTEFISIPLSLSVDNNMKTTLYKQAGN